jgi:transcriptional regulator with XRE-family HTH domain
MKKKKTKIRINSRKISKDVLAGIGKRLQKERLKKKLSAAQLADLIMEHLTDYNIRTHYSLIYQIENERMYPSLSLIKILAGILNFSVDNMLEIKREKQNKRRNNLHAAIAY